MDMILGGLLFALLVIGQFAAVIAVHAEGACREPTVAPASTDHRTRLIWEGGF